MYAILATTLALSVERPFGAHLCDGDLWLPAMASGPGAALSDATGATSKKAAGPGFDERPRVCVASTVADA